MSAIQEELMQKLYGRNIWIGHEPRSFEADVQGWNGDHPSLEQIVSSPGSKVVIDIGVWKGQSTITMADTLRRHRINGAVIAIDTFLGSLEHWEGMHSLFERDHGMPNLYWTFLSNVQRAGLTEFVIPLPQTSITAAQLLKDKGITAGVIHVDAAHEYKEVLRDAIEYWEILETGGFMIGDDYGDSWPGVIQASHEFARKVGAPLKIEGPKWILEKL